MNDSFFNEFTVRLPKPAAPVVEALAAKRILGGLPVSRLIPNDKSVENLLLLAATGTGPCEVLSISSITPRLGKSFW